jgi:dTDP-glucose 4,6-dehydratase
VDRSITNPLAFIDSNVVGTANVLELCKQDNARMVHVSTDEVYGHLQLDEDPFTEDHPLKPRSPYSASKASSDLLVQSYITTFGVNASITRCCNNYGPRQHNEKLIPTVIRSLAQGQYIPVYGKGDNIREWIHARDHAKAIIEVLHKKDAAELYNIPGSAEFTNLELIDQIIETVVDKAPGYRRQEYIKFVEDRAGHDFKYAISTKHNLDAVANQQKFDLSETVDCYLYKYLKHAKLF